MEEAVAENEQKMTLRSDLWYSINWDAVQTVEDVKVVLRGLDIAVRGQYAEQHPEVKAYLADEPLPPLVIRMLMSMAGRPDPIVAL